MFLHLCDVGSLPVISAREKKRGKIDVAESAVESTKCVIGVPDSVAVRGASFGHKSAIHYNTIKDHFAFTFHNSYQKQSAIAL